MDQNSTTNAWGQKLNSLMGKFIIWLEDKEDQLNAIANMPMRFQYGGIDPTASKLSDIIHAFETLGIEVPSGVSPELFAARIKRVARDMAQGGMGWRQLITPKKEI